MKKLSLCFITATAVMPFLYADVPLTAPPAPFKAKTATSKPAEKIEIRFDAKNRTFIFGSKRFIFRQNGTFVYQSGPRSVMQSYFFINTPYSGWQPCTSYKVTPKYTGGIACVTQITADEKTNTLTYKGVAPFHQKSSKVQLLKPWSITVSLTKDNKLDFKFHFETPDGKLLKDRGIYFTGFRNEKRSYPPKNTKDWGNYTTSVLSNDIAEDAITIKVINKTYSHPLNKKTGEFRISPLTNDWHFTIDPGVLSAGKALPPGGVDFVETDDLIIPLRGKRNLLLNPYFAQISSYYWTCGTNMGRGAGEKAVPVAGNALFGKYSMPMFGSIYLNSVPVEPGNYVLSFYAKGKGSIYFQLSDETSWYNRLASEAVWLKGDPTQWKRYEFSFKFPKRGLINMIASLRGEKGSVSFVDGFQLEAGTKATAFEAPLITAGLNSNGGRNFFEPGKPMNCELEFSTLSNTPVSGSAAITVTNFFKEKTLSLNYKFNVKKGEYPRCKLPIDKLPQGIYIVRVDFQVPSAKLNKTEFFRFAIMPFLKNEHATARIFSMTYYGGMGYIKSANPNLLQRYQQIGIGCFGHASAMSPEALALYKKYKVIAFDGACADRESAEKMKFFFPGLEVPPGHTYFTVDDPRIAHWNKCGVLPDYKLVGGWTPAYREKFRKAVREQLKKMPGLKAYRWGSEWPISLKREKEYPEMVVEYAKIVKEVYPDAWVYEAGDCNMDLTGGVAQLDYLLPQWKKYNWRPDLLASHTYTKDITQLHQNLKGFLAVAAKHGYSKTPIAFPEGMHFYPYQIPQWGREMVEWGGNGYGGGALSYDLGWFERLSTAYYMRCYLIYFTIYDRLWCGTSSANYINSVFMDLTLTPRSIQKVPNTLGILLGNPKKYVGDFTFAPETKCLVWIDEKDCPLAAVWNENKQIDLGQKDSPYATFKYSGAKFYDMMGVERKPVKPGMFPVSPFPVFIKGRAGDTTAFTKALSEAVISNNGTLPFRLNCEFSTADTLELTLSSDLARVVKGNISVYGKEYSFKLEKAGKQVLKIRLPQKLSAQKINQLEIPYVCKVDGQTVRSTLKTSVILVKRFNGDWSRIPSVRITNKSDILNYTDNDFSASYQLGWDSRKMYLRITVTDDDFNPGNLPGYRYRNDIAQVYFDTRRSAQRYGRKGCDEDDYEYGLMPTMDGKRCEVWRAVSPDMQLTLGIAAPKNSVIATEIPSKFTRTKTGYIYEAEFPADYLLPMRLVKGCNFAFALYITDSDRKVKGLKGLSLATKPGSGCWNRPQFWPTAVLTD